MSTKHTSDCLRKAADDEPIFVLRAQDKTAPDAIRLWAETNRSTLTHEKYQSARDLANEMEAWPDRKYPD